MRVNLLKLFMLIIIMFSGGCLNWFKSKPSILPKTTTVEDLEGFSKESEINSGVIDKFIDGSLLNIKKNTQTAEEIKETSNRIKENTKNIEESVIKINDSTNQLEQKTGDIGQEEIVTLKEESKNIPNTIEIINKKVEEITQSSNEIILNSEEQKKSIKQKIQPLSEKLKTISTELKETSVRVQQYEKTASGLGQERDKAIEERDKAIKAQNDKLHKMLRWLIILCIIGAGAFGVLALMYGSKLGLTLSSMCMVIMAIAIFVETYFIYIVIAGGVIIAVLVGLLIYNIIIQKKAFKEVVDTVEVTQEKLSNEDRKKLFGEKGQTGIMDNFQSKTTMNLVKKEKKKMGSLWLYAKNNGEQD